MTWEVWDPFEDMRRMQREMDQLFKASFRGLKPAKGVRAPLADVKETKKEVTAKIELPGVDKKDIDLKITENMLSVKAEIKTEKEEKEKGFYRRERSYQSFQRAFSLPTKIIPKKAKARLEKGVLEVIMPKAKQIKEKDSAKIAIK